MSVSVAEYLGQRTDYDASQISPVIARSGAQCPFMHRTCDKVSKGNHPVCSVRKSTGSLWIVCEHRLCSTRQKEKTKVPSKKDPTKLINGYVEIPLVPHQVDILHQVAKTVYGNQVLKQNVGVKREVTVPLPDAGINYHADYVMRNFTDDGAVNKILLEMQGGGETSSTGAISRHITAWSSQNTTNEFLRTIVSANPIETNAWRRQQEQFLVKGNVVNQTGGKIVFAVGNLLFDYLQNRFQHANLRDLQDHNWTLCLLAFIEDNSENPQQGPIPLIIDNGRLLFTNYSAFVQFLTNQGGPCPEIFEGEFLLLDGNKINVT